MKSLFVPTALALATGSLLLAGATGHGGTYRGPGDTVPPGAGGGGGGTGGPVTPGPSPGTPGTPGPNAPGTPGPGTPGTPNGPGAATPLTPSSMGGTDLTVWDFWWGFNKDPYLALKNRIHAKGSLTGSDDYFLGQGQTDQSKDYLAPSRQQIDDDVIPALLGVLEERGTPDDILTGALIALGKIGDRVGEDGRSRFQDVIERFLDHPNQEVAESATIALGVLGNESAVPLLVDLMTDSPAGRKAVGSTEVVPRTRSFAAYALGLLGHRTSDEELRRSIAIELFQILESPKFSTRDLKVAAMTAFGLTPIESLGTEPVELDVHDAAACVASREAQLAFLLDYFDEKEQRANERTRHYFVRAHAPTAMARLLDGAPEWARQSVARELLDAVRPRADVAREVQQSVVLALGSIGDADAGGIDKEIRRTLERLAKEGDQQSRRFALIALAQAGGRPGQGEKALDGETEARGVLLRHLSKGKTTMKPWAGLAVGVLQRQLLDHEELPSSEAQLSLRAAAADCDRPAEVGAHLIGLGLSRDLGAKDILLEKLHYFKGSDEARGYAAVGLGLMQDLSAVEPIQEIIVKSKYKPEVLRQAAIALGLLGDKTVVDELVKMLGDAKGLSTHAALATALGAIGDSRSVTPLVRMLQDDSITETARSFAAVALGIVCDKEDLPFNSKIAVGINYRANTVTLTGEGGTGILEIL